VTSSRESQSPVGNPVLLQAGDLTDRHTTKSKQEVECSTGGKDRIRKGLRRCTAEGKRPQTVREALTYSEQERQTETRQLEEDRNSGGDSRLEQAGNQLGHFSSQSKNQLAQERLKHTTRIRRELDLATKTQTFQYFSQETRRAQLDAKTDSFVKKQIRFTQFTEVTALPLSF
jgi:Arc/MetJ-type ribon-helix-helix transcriptional regulator